MTMKRIYYSLLIGLTAIFLLGGCEDFNDQFEGLDDLTKPTNETQYTYELTAADYDAIKTAALKVALTAEDTAKALSISTNKYFTNSVVAADYIPFVLATEFRYGDINSSALVTYAFGEDRPSYFTDLTSIFILGNSDYQQVWSEDSYVASLTPAKSPAENLPAVLAVKFPDATNGLYKFVEYNYSSVEAAADVTEVVYFSEDWENHTVTSSPYTVIGENGWVSEDVLASLEWYCRTFNNNKYAQVSSNNSGAINEVYLVSSEIDLTNSTNPKLTFDVNVGYWNHNGLTVLVSKNYSGNIADVESATWVDLTSSFTLPETPTGSYGVIAPAGTADLTAYAGNKIHIAFKYNGDGRTDADPKQTTTYQVDNIKVSETKVALSVPSTEKQYVVYMYNGTTWVPGDESFVELQVVDYAAMNKQYLSSAEVLNYLPQLLKMKFPYAQSGDIKNVVYKSGSNATYSGVTQFAYTDGEWINNTYKTNKTEQYIFSKNGWIFDPTIRMTMVKEDYQLMVDYVLATPEIAVFAHPKYKNEEYYWGFSSRYSNVNFRLSYRNPYFTGEFVQPATIDEELSSLETDEAKVALMYERLKSGVAKFLQLKYPEAVPEVSGIEVHYNVRLLIYYANGVSAGNENRNYEFKCTAAGENGQVPTFEYVSDEKVE